MRDFNLAKSINYAVSQTTVKNTREVNVDPLKPNFGYLKTSELAKGFEYPMRALPPHPEKNPLGYIKKEMYQFPDKLDMESKFLPKHQNRFVMVPGCYKEGSDDYMLGVYKRMNDLVNGPTNYDFIPDPDEAKAELGHGTFQLREGAESPTRADMFRDLLNGNDELRTFIKVISSKWTQIIIPVLLYATADTKKNEQGYDRSFNYQPDEDKENVLPRLIQFNLSKDLQESLLDKMAEKTTSSPKGYDPLQDADKGRDIVYTRKDKGHGFSFGTKEAFDEDWQGKFDANPDYYPDLVSRELKRSYAPESIEAALKSCPKKYLQPLIDFGILDTE